jgi:hypothetical protein
MALTYDTIATTTLGSAAANINFSSIPQTYTDLVLVATIRTASNNQSIYMNFNGDNSNNYAFGYLGSEGSSVLTVYGTYPDQGLQIGRFALSSDSIPNAIEAHMLSYRDTGKQKNVIVRHSINRGGTGTGRLEYFNGVYLSTAAITSINLRLPSGGNFAAGSIVALYGILRA